MYFKAEGEFYWVLSEWLRIPGYPVHLSVRRKLSVLSATIWQTITGGSPTLPWGAQKFRKNSIQPDKILKTTNTHALPMPCQHSSRIFILNQDYSLWSPWKPRGLFFRGQKIKAVSFAWPSDTYCGQASPPTNSWNPRKQHIFCLNFLPGRKLWITHLSFWRADLPDFVHHVQLIRTWFSNFRIASENIYE